MSAILMCAFFALSLNTIKLNKELTAATLFAVMAAAVFAMPIQTTVFAFIVYASIEGALKIFSNYNPLIHIGQDIILGLMVLKSASDIPTLGAKKFYTIPGFLMVAVFLVWLLLQYFNPFGLGLIPSIAGTKIYISMIFFFAICYHHLDQKNFEDLFFFVVIIAAIQATLAIFEYPPAGQNFMFSLHPKYRQICSDRFIGVFYRPFGTGAVPGSPATWIALAAPMGAYILLNPASTWLRKFVVAVYLGVSVPALIYCQVRTAMITSVMAMAMVLFFPRPGIGKRLVTLAAVITILAAILAPQLKSIFQDPDEGLIKRTPTGKISAAAQDSIRAGILRARTLSLTNMEKLSEARGGALKAMVALGQKTIWGIGLSRTGAAAGPWVDRINKDPYFGPQWSFADNVYRAVFTDIGLLGLLAWVAMIASYIVTIMTGALKKDGNFNGFMVWTSGAAALIVMLSAFGNEGPLYSPISMILWLHIAVGMKGLTYAK